MPQPELSQGRQEPFHSTFIVDAVGNVEAPESKVPQIVIHREQLNPRHKTVQIDLDSVTSSSGTPSIYVIMQDFGLPLRAITVNQLFITNYFDEGQPEETTHTTPEKANKLLVSCPSYRWNERTERYTDGRNHSEGEIKLADGDRVVFAHDGKSSDYRTTFIRNDAHVLGFHDTWRDPEEGNFEFGYVPLIGLVHEQGKLTISAYDNANAEVIFEKMVSQADASATSDTSGIDAFDKDRFFDIVDAIKTVLSPDQLEKVYELWQENNKLAAENKSLNERNVESRMREQSLEVALNRNKNLLSETQSQLQATLNENDRLKKQAGSTPKDDSSRFRSEASGSKTDPMGYCKSLGITPDRLFEMHPDDAIKVVNALRVVYSKLYHPDTNKEINPQFLKDINNATDKILERIRTGYWGR